MLERVTELAYNTFKEMREEERLNPSEVQEFKKRVIKPMYPHKREEDNGEARNYGCC